MKSGRILTTIFCDDVRREEGNKLSYMGVYVGVLGVPKFPTTLPRLCFALTLRIYQDSIPSEIRFRLCRDDEVIAENVVPPEAIASARADGANALDDRYTHFGTVFQMFPVLLSGPCFLRARAICDGEEIRGGSLAVVEQKDMERAIRGFAGQDISAPNLNPAAT